MSFHAFESFPDFQCDTLHHLSKTFPMALANRQIQVMQIETHLQFNCYFKQKEKGNIQSIVSAESLDIVGSSELEYSSVAIRFLPCWNSTNNNPGKVW